MAKGDDTASQNQIDYRGNTAQNHLDNSRDLIVNQNHDFWNNFLRSLQEDSSSRNEIQNDYRGIINGSPLTNSAAYAGYNSLANGQGRSDFSADPALRGRTNESLAGYSDFAKTGGYSDRDIADLRARAIAPTRAIYGNAQNNINRQRSLQGGYSPNYTASSAKLAREMSQSIGDANINANASIADQIRSGKLAGLSGLAQTSLGQQGADTSLNSINSQLNNQLRLAGLSGMSDLDKTQLGAKLSGIGGMSNLYGTAPGLSGQTGNMALNSNNQLLNTNSLQNQLSLGIMGAQNQKAGIPSDFQQAAGNVGSVLGLIGQAGGAMSGLPTKSPYKSTPFGPSGLDY